MQKDIDIVRDFYDQCSEVEWKRIANRPEFLLTCRFFDRYIKAGDRVLDIGGGPGRYSLYLAEKGADVTLFDLSQSNVNFAAERAAEAALPLKTVCGDARYADTLVEGEFDHVLLMGPLYHLLEENDREAAVRAAMKLLKPGGKLYVSFISIFGGIIYMMKFCPDMICSDIPMEVKFRSDFEKGLSSGGDAFTKAYFIQIDEVESFMSRFTLKKLHILGQEGIMSPCESNLMSSPPEIVKAWLDLSERLCDKPEYLTWSEHIMYIGEKL